MSNWLDYIEPFLGYFAKPVTYLWHKTPCYKIKKLKCEIKELKQMILTKKSEILPPPNIPVGFQILHNTLLFDKVNNIYYCYNCFLKNKYETVAGDEYYKTCNKCGITTKIKEPSLPPAADIEKY